MMPEDRLDSLTAPPLWRQAAEALHNLLGLTASEISAVCRGRYQRSTYRVLWMLLTLPLLFLWQTGNWICLFLDELFFPAARKVKIVKPLLIVGAPRSGTTHLHRVLAQASDDFQSAPAWELLFAPSILQKKICRGLIVIDRRVGAPFQRLFTWIEAFALRRFADTHPGSLRDPEEDYFYLNPLFACTGWMIAFPAWRGLRQWMPGCAEMSDDKRRQALHFYKRCLQKQLYVKRSQPVLLSKNASFSSWMDLLPEFFPDARWLVCTRSPLETLPSMLSTAEEAQRGFFSEMEDDALLRQLEACMQAHYQTLFNCVPGLPADQVVVVSQAELKQRLPEVLGLLAARFDLAYTATFKAGMASMGEVSASHKSRHRYALSDYGLDGVTLIATCPECTTTLTEIR